MSDNASYVLSNQLLRGSTDADFQKQFGTYTLMSKLYDEEKNARYQYFIMEHNLSDQFFKEDAERNK